MIDSAVATAKDIEILCYVNDCDDSYNPADFPEARIIRGERLVMSENWNALIPYAKGDIFQLSADDVIYRTNGWDVIIEMAYAEVPDKILMAFGDDLCGNGKEFATLPFVSRKWVEAVGYFTPPGFTGDYADTWLNDVAKMIGRSKSLPFVTEHLHPVWGKAPMDATYEEKLDRQGNAAELYNSRLAERQADAAKLRAVMHGD